MLTNILIVLAYLFVGWMYVMACDGGRRTGFAVRAAAVSILTLVWPLLFAVRLMRKVA